MFLDVSRFIKERFPLKVTIPLSIIVFTAPLSLTDFQFTNAIMGWLSIFTLLFILRLVDDISDLPVDRICHPEWGLTTGNIKPLNLIYAGIIAIIIILILNRSGKQILFIGAIILFYALFYSLKKRISLLLQPFLVNTVFLGIPFYAGWIAENRAWFPLSLLGLFNWTAVIAHDFAHSVHGPKEYPSDVAGILILIGPRKTAGLALGCFLAAGLLGVFFWWISGKPLLFISLLACTTFQIIYLSIKLIKHPIHSNAKAFYIFGFTFFLIPFMGLIVDQLLKLG